MICVSYLDFDYAELVRTLKEQKPELAELRLDGLNLSREELKTVLGWDFKVMVTCKDKDFMEKLSFAVENGADYVDIDVEMEEAEKQKLIDLAQSKNCKTIISYHNYEKTPQKAELEHIVEWCSETKPDVIKISCMVKTLRDNARLFGLLDSEYSMIIIGMGEYDRITRILAPKLGAFCTFASPYKGKEAAPGQISYEDLKKVMAAIGVV
jgi:3-dehydroquinate dehydratase type I